MGGIFKSRGDFLTPERAEKYGKELQRLAHVHGNLKKEKIVEEARKENSPLHDYFEWDKEKAAYNYLIYQVRRLCSSIYVEITVDGKPVETRYMVTVEQEEGGLIFAPIQKVMETPFMREDYLLRALEELDTFKSKYEHLLELKGLWEMIDEIKERRLVKCES